MSSYQDIQTEHFYNMTELAALDPRKIPHHVAVIPDGNRRWAKKNNVFLTEGHRAGADNLIRIVKAAKELGIKVITFYSISTENWSRDPFEMRALLWLLESYLIEQCPVMIANGVRYNTIGDLSRFAKTTNQVIQQTKQATAHCNEIDMIMALNYGSHNEISRAFQKIFTDIQKGEIASHQVDEKMIARYLDTAAWKDPELLIRTSGERRLSNFLLWQTSYSEICLPTVLWPDFTPKTLLESILDFQSRERRMGGDNAFFKSH